MVHRHDTDVVACLHAAGRATSTAVANPLWITDDDGGTSEPSRSSSASSSSLQRRKHVGQQQRAGGHLIGASSRSPSSSASAGVGRGRARSGKQQQQQGAGRGVPAVRGRLEAVCRPEFRREMRRLSRPGRYAPHTLGVRVRRPLRQEL